MTRTKQETIAYFTQFIEDYKNNPETPNKIRACHVKYGQVTGEEMMRRFTI